MDVTGNNYQTSEVIFNILPYYHRIKFHLIYYIRIAQNPIKYITCQLNPLYSSREYPSFSQSPLGLSIKKYLYLWMAQKMVAGTPSGFINSAILKERFGFGFYKLKTNSISVMTTERNNIGKFSLLNSALSWMSTLIVYPLNKINVRLQVNSTSKNGGWAAFRQLIGKQGIRGCYKGVSMTAFGMLPTFLITYLYEKLNSTWRHTPTLRSSRLYYLSPMINVFLAGLPTLLLSTPTSMLMTLIHSEQLSAKQALTKMKAQHFKAYVDIYRSSIVTMSIFFCIRQQLIENEQYVFQRKLRMTEKQSILATAVVSSVLANVIYQPVEALQARLVVENKDGGLIRVISNLRRQKNCVRTLFKGFCTKTTSTGIFNCVYFPVYSKLKNEFSLRVY